MQHTASLFSTVGSYLHAGYSKVVDYVWQEMPRIVSPNRNRVMPFNFEEH